MAVVSCFFLLLADYTITEKKKFFCIVDLQAKRPFSQEPHSIYNEVTQHSMQQACIFQQCIVIFAHELPIMGFSTESNS